MKDGLEKSSRGKADLFEVLVAEFIARIYKLRKEFSSEISDLKDYMNKFEDGALRIKEQEESLNVAKDKIKSLLDEEASKHKKIIDVDWVGRFFKGKGTISDVDVIFFDGYKIGLSLKSTRIGRGTQKNMGYTFIKEHLKINIDKDLKIMWNTLRKRLSDSGGEYKRLSSLKVTEIRENKRKFPLITKIGKEAGFYVQKEAVIQSVKNFNELDVENQRKFLTLIYGIEDLRKLINLLVEGNQVLIFNNDVYLKIINSKKFIAKSIKPKSFVIYADGKEILRLQASFTNGVGISAFCERAFLID